jgi:hypothetical protein
MYVKQGDKLLIENKPMVLADIKRHIETLIGNILKEENFPGILPLRFSICEFTNYYGNDEIGMKISFQSKKAKTLFSSITMGAPIVIMNQSSVSDDIAWYISFNKIMREYPVDDNNPSLGTYKILKEYITFQRESLAAKVTIDKSAASIAGVIVQDVFDFTMKVLIGRYEMDKFGEKEIIEIRNQIVNIVKSVDPNIARELQNSDPNSKAIKKFMMSGKELIDEVIIAHSLPEISDDDISMFYDYEDPDLNVSEGVNTLIERAQMTAAVDKKHLN